MYDRDLAEKGISNQDGGKIHLVFEIEKELTLKFQELLSKLQQLNTDPFGYGRYYRINQKDKGMTIEEWREKFPHIRVNFKIDVEITSHGIVE